MWWPRAAALAFALTGDGERAHKVARRALIRAVAHWRDLRNPYTLEAWFTKTVVAMSRRAHLFDALMRRRRAPDRPDGVDASSARLWRELHRLRFKTRAALVLAHLEGLNETQTADALGTSVAGVRSLTAHGADALDRGQGGEAVGAELRSVLAAVAARGAPDLAGLETWSRRVRAARLVGAFEVAVVATAAVGGGYAAAVTLARDRPDADRASVVEIDDRDDRAPSVQVGAPNWCPDPNGMRRLPADRVDERTGNGQAFVVALTKRYEDGDDYGVMWRVDDRWGGPHPRRWPRLPDVSGLDIVHQGPGGGDAALRDQCGVAVAAQTWIIVYENHSEPESHQLAVYLLRRAGEWKVWATNKPAPIL